MSHPNHDLLSQHEFVKALKAAVDGSGDSLLVLSHRLYTATGESFSPHRIQKWLSGHMPSTPVMIKVFASIGAWSDLKHCRNPRDLTMLCRHEFMAKMAKVLKMHDGDIRSMAEDVGVDHRTLQSRIKGDNFPHARMQKVYAKMREVSK